MATVFLSASVDCSWVVYTHVVVLQLVAQCDDELYVMRVTFPVVYVRTYMQELPPSVANGTSRPSSKRYSYSLLDAQQQYPQQYGIAVRQSYISTAPVSL